MTRMRARKAWWEEPLRIELSQEEVLADLVGKFGEITSPSDGRS